MRDEPHAAHASPARVGARAGPVLAHAFADARPADVGSALQAAAIRLAAPRRRRLRCRRDRRRPHRRVPAGAHNRADRRAGGHFRCSRDPQPAPRAAPATTTSTRATTRARRLPTGWPRCAVHGWRSTATASRSATRCSPSAPGGTGRTRRPASQHRIRSGESGRCAPAPNTCVRSMTAGVFSSTARASRTSPRIRPSARRRARSRTCIDIAADPAQRERMTFPSPKTGAAGVAGLANPAHARRSARPAAVLGDLGGSDLRPDGAVAGSRRRLLHRLRGDAAAVCHGGPKVRRQSGRVLRVHARQPHLRQLRHRAAADRPLEAGAQAERSDALCRRRQGARRRHRDLRRAAGRDRRRAVRLDSLELHPSRCSPATRTTPIASRSRSMRRG